MLDLLFEAFIEALHTFAWFRRIVLIVILAALLAFGAFGLHGVAIWAAIFIGFEVFGYFFPEKS